MGKIDEPRWAMANAAMAQWQWPMAMRNPPCTYLKLPIHAHRIYTVCVLVIAISRLGIVLEGVLRVPTARRT